MFVTPSYLHLQTQPTNYVYVYRKRIIQKFCVYFLFVDRYRLWERWRF